MYDNVHYRPHSSSAPSLRTGGTFPPGEGMRYALSQRERQGVRRSGGAAARGVRGDQQRSVSIFSAWVRSWAATQAVSITRSTDISFSRAPGTGSA